MSDEDKKTNEPENPFADPLKTFGDLYNQTLKQAAGQWEETARSPLFLAAMANNVEQTMQMQKQMQEMIATALQALNLPTKDDLLLLVEKIDQLSSDISGINARLDKLIKEKNKNLRSKTKTKGGETKS